MPINSAFIKLLDLPKQEYQNMIIRIINLQIKWHVPALVHKYLHLDEAVLIHLLDVLGYQKLLL